MTDRRGPVKKYSIAAVLRSYGADLSDRRTGKVKIRCPFHDDSRPSAQVDFSSQRFVCWAGHCAISGDAIDVIIQVDHVGFQVAESRAEAIAGGTPAEIPSARPRDTPGLFSKSRARGGGS